MALDWTGRRVLVTGAAGFVGSNLVRALVDGGADVVGLDLAKTSPSLRVLELGELPMLQRDVRNAERLPWAFALGNGESAWKMPEIVFHLAGAGHIDWCQKNPLAAWEANVQGTWVVLEACRTLPAGQIQVVVVASSNHVFGSRRAAWRDDDPCGQTDVYGTSKSMVDLLVRSYGAMGLPVAALRHVNCFGPADPHRSHLVTGTICDLLDGKAPVIRGDGRAIKGYLHVDRIVEAYLLLAESLASGRIEAGSAWNAAPDAPISVLALVDTIIRFSGVDVTPEILGEDQSQLGYVEHLDSSKLRALGWKAYGLDIGLYETFAWYKAHGGMAWL